MFGDDIAFVLDDLSGGDDVGHVSAKEHGQDESNDGRHLQQTTDLAAREVVGRRNEQPRHVEASSAIYLASQLRLTAGRTICSSSSSRQDERRAQQDAVAVSPKELWETAKKKKKKRMGGGGPEPDVVIDLGWGQADFRE
jgi:hypothetical protein